MLGCFILPLVQDLSSDIGLILYFGSATIGVSHWELEVSVTPLFYSCIVTHCLVVLPSPTLFLAFPVSVVNTTYMFTYFRAPCILLHTQQVLDKQAYGLDYCLCFSFCRKESYAIFQNMNAWCFWLDVITFTCQTEER